MTKAVRNADLKMGIYYSLYEWFNSLYNTDVDLFVEKHVMPQFKDVVTRYQPSLIFSDGEWDHPHTTWKSTELLSWLYNESPSREGVVVNDRWGRETRHQHGGYYTTEYGSGSPSAEVPWEENRGMAYSYGFSRSENLSDYSSTQQLLYMLIDIVSRGGNLLLNIGPTADGRIPLLMQERLSEIGDWLAVNGEAIYGTTVWNKSCQWTEGKVQDAKRGQYKVPYDIMKLTVNPDPGFAAKEVFFTKKGSTLYATVPVYPNRTLVLNDVKTQPKTKVILLGVDEELVWKQVNTNLEIKVPNLNPSNTPCKYAWTFKISAIE